MAIKEYRIPAFFGIDQSTQENEIDEGYSPDACNMDTEDGSLRVANGYVRHIATALPGTGAPKRLYVWRSGDTTRYVVLAGNCLYAWTDTVAEPAWTCIYTYPDTLTLNSADFCEVRFGSTDTLLIACGEQQIVKWDGGESASVFGSAEGLSNSSVSYLAMHYGRLFAAGDPDNPGRLYWSQAPGGSRTIESWAQAEESENVSGGHVEIGPVGGDPITGLCSLSNQLLIFKRASIYRLLGDRPSNYKVYRVNAEVEKMVDSACLLYGDTPYWMTGAGLYYHDGQTAQRTRDARCIKGFLERASLTRCRAAENRDRLYFTAYEQSSDPQEAGEARTADNAVIVYDMIRRTYMLRRGFPVSDLFALDGTLYLIGPGRYVYRFNEGADYDGAPISAWWQTPLTDVQNKAAVKCPRELFLRGRSESGSEGAILRMDVGVGSHTHYHRYLMPERAEEVLEIPLLGEGRTFSLRLYNEGGSRWHITGGLQMLYGLRLRTY
ncbi:MAG: hypothetical protein PHO41_01880 [Eubacteriales bacterium]|nr:hypothetical protein [Eubacteriales bacterium]